MLIRVLATPVGSLSVAGCIVAASLVFGCANRPAKQEAFFSPESQLSATQRILDEQADRGAQVDGTLFPVHFDGASLNTLGRDKLNRIMRGQGSARVVYLDLPEGDALTGLRREAIATHFAGAGLLPTQYKVELGPNPAMLHAVGADLGKLPKLEATPAAGGTTAPTPAILSPALSAEAPIPPTHP